MSGVNFSVGNQLATPSIHAAALANRPAAGQPGRVFIDTNNPSTGIYRDTGTAWIQIASNGGGGIPNLQQVTGVGNNTNLNLVLNYEDQTVSNALVFYNDTLAQEEYVVLKRQTGITTNDCLVIQSRGNISPSTNPAGIMIDGANDVIKTFYGTAYTEQGLKLDFANQYYKLGTGDISAGFFAIDQVNSQITSGGNIGEELFLIDFGISTVKIGDYTNTNLKPYITFDQNITTTYQGNDIGLNLDFANDSYVFGDPAKTRIQVNNNTGDSFIGDPDFVYEGVLLRVNSNTTTPKISTEYQNSEIGLKLDFANEQYQIGAATINNGVGLLVDNLGKTISIVDYTNGINGFVAQLGGAPVVSIGDSTTNYNGTFLIVNDSSQYIEVSNNLKSGTAGGSSGQHLKIRVGGVDYKIALLNP